MKIKSRIHEGLYEAEGVTILSDKKMVGAIIFNGIDPVDCFYDENRDCLFYCFIEKDILNINKESGVKA